MSSKKFEFSGAIQTGEPPTPGATATSGNSTRHTRDEPGPVPFSADELRRISWEISANGLPSVEATRLELMEIDPWNVHAYWHIDVADMAAGRAGLPENARDARLVLRFRDVSPRADGTGADEPFDIEVREDSSNWYVNLWRDAKRYSAEIGLRAADGVFVPLTRSNEVTTPRGGPSPGLDFLQVEVRTLSAPEPAPAGGSTTPDDILLRDLFPQRRPPVDEFPLVMPESFDLPLGEPIFPRLELPGQETATADLRAGEALEAATPSAGPERPPTPLALEAILGKSVFSPSSMDAAVAVSASIVIDGQGSPDAPLSLFGDPVLLQPDGRFTLCLPLECRPDLVALLHHVLEQPGKE